MLIVLPPSETKAPGGSPSPMSLSFPALDPVRSSLLDDLSTLPLPAMMSALKLPESKADEAADNQRLRTAPVMPALLRYTGVLYDALDPATLPKEAWSRLAIASALFGLVRASLPEKLYDTAYVLACDVASADGRLTEDELRMLGEIREVLELDRLHAAAIELAAKARHRRL